MTKTKVLIEQFLKEQLVKTFDANYVFMISRWLTVSEIFKAEISPPPRPSNKKKNNEI